MSRPNLAAATERMQGTAAIALALVLVVLLFVYLVPRQGDIAAAMNARRAAAAEEAERAVAPTPAPAAIPPAEPSPVPEPEAAALPAPSPKAAPPPEPPPSSSAAPAAAQLLSRPVVLDTATILIKHGKVRLAGIKAAPLARKCGEDGSRGWFCGVEARTRFRSWLRARSIACDVPAGFGDKAEEMEARCDLAGEDIGGWLVANGYAEAVAGGIYTAAETKAKADKLGIWAEKRATD